MKFTQEEIKVLKEMAQEKIRFDNIFRKDNGGKEIPIGNYSDWVKAMEGSVAAQILKEVKKDENSYCR